MLAGTLLIGGSMSAQITGNVGLYLVCTELSKQGFNVMPTARNAKGVDIVGYNDQGKSFTVQVKTLTKKVSVPFGKGLGYLSADYYVIVVHAHDAPVYHVLTRAELQNIPLAKSNSKENGAAYWLEVKEYYKKEEFVTNAWSKIRPT
jgi:hypothetical protein